MKEFELIRQIQLATSVAASRYSDPCEAVHGTKLGIGDDAAVIEVAAGNHLVAATDTLNAGIHFPSGTPADDIAYKSLAVNLSDLAAMGAKPCWALLSLSLPDADEQWIRLFAAGFNALAQKHEVVLVGGDTTHGSLSVTVTALGLIKPDRQLQRDGANPGDFIVVSGSIGGAARVLELLQAGLEVNDRELLDRPQPRVDLGQALIGYASACIDISDGLLADLGHLLEASGYGAQIELEKLPVDAQLVNMDQQKKWVYPLSGGDDYELLFTLPPRHVPRLAELSSALDINLSIVGEVKRARGIVCTDAQGHQFHPPALGFEHFGHKA